MGSPGTAAVLREALGDDPRVREVFAVLEREMMRQGTIPNSAPFLFLTPAERIGVKEGKGGALAELCSVLFCISNLRSLTSRSLVVTSVLGC